MAQQTIGWRATLRKPSERDRGDTMLFRAGGTLVLAGGIGLGVWGPSTPGATIPHPSPTPVGQQWAGLFPIGTGPGTNRGAPCQCPESVDKLSFQIPQARRLEEKTTLESRLGAGHLEENSATATDHSSKGNSSNSQGTSTPT